jgi:hypothetical protein
MGWICRIQVRNPTSFARNIIPTPRLPTSSYSSPNYLNTSAPPYVFYVRKHDPLIIYDSVGTNSQRAALIRNFNDFATDVNASAMPQWSFITPNMVDDAHDTDINFLSQWLQYWLLPLLNNTNFNDNKTLILLTFDESETYTLNNQIFAVLLGGAIPTSMRGTIDSTYYTHYSALSTVQANWGLGSLGRGDTNKLSPTIPLHTSRSSLTIHLEPCPTYTPSSPTQQATKTTTSAGPTSL